jgi:hypothetical protein
MLEKLKKKAQEQGMYTTEEKERRAPSAALHREKQLIVKTRFKE